MDGAAGTLLPLKNPSSWSRCCLLLAIGVQKAEAIRRTVEGAITAQVTATALQLHREVVAIMDEEAASRLSRREYYAEVERGQKLLESGQLKLRI